MDKNSDQAATIARAFAEQRIADEKARDLDLKNREMQTELTSKTTLLD